MPISAVIRAAIAQLEKQRAQLEKQRSELKEIISALRGILNVPADRVYDLSLNDQEKRLLEEALYRADGNQSKAARILKVSRDQVRYKMEKHGLNRKSEHRPTLKNRALSGLDSRCENGGVASNRLRGPFPLRDHIIDKEVALRCPGAFALGDPKGPDTLQVFFVGRSDNNVNNQLHVYVGSYFYFSYEYSSTAQQAFETECVLYHQFEPRDNPIHPQRPANESWTCPRCKLLG